MISGSVLSITAVLLALVALACTALCLAWSNPAWRRRLASEKSESEVRDGGLSGWPARVGSGVISAAIGACALVAWSGLYYTLTAIGLL